MVEYLRLLIERLEIDRIEIVVDRWSTAACPPASGFVIQLPALRVFASLVGELLVALSSVGGFLAWLRRQRALEGLVALCAIWLLVGHHVGV